MNNETNKSTQTDTDETPSPGEERRDGNTRNPNDNRVIEKGSSSQPQHIDPAVDKDNPRVDRLPGKSQAV